MENHQFIIGKSTINEQFSIAMLNYQRVLKWKFWDVGEFPTTDESSFAMLQAEFLEFLSKDTCWFATQLQDIFAILALAKTKGQNTLYIRIYYIYNCGLRVQTATMVPPTTHRSST